MCFSPQISLFTALVEFGSAAFIFLRFKKTIIIKYLSLIVFLLGLYQFSEYMLCTTNDIQLWGTIGFITYTVLPPLCLIFILKYTKINLKKTFLLYLPAIIFSLIAIFTKNFIITGSCSTIFVTIQNIFVLSNNHQFLTLIYWLYYFSYIMTGCLFIVRAIKSKKNNNKKRIYYIILSAIVLSLLPALILIIILPSLKIMFPSIYCQFALLFTIMALLCVHLDNKLQKEKL